MIKRMIKPWDAAPSATQATATTVEGAPDIPSADGWWTATWTTPTTEHAIEAARWEGRQQPVNRRNGAVADWDAEKDGAIEILP